MIISIEAAADERRRRASSDDVPAARVMCHMTWHRYDLSRQIGTRMCTEIRFWGKKAKIWKKKKMARRYAQIKCPDQISNS